MGKVWETRIRQVKAPPGQGRYSEFWALGMQLNPQAAAVRRDEAFRTTMGRPKPLFLLWPKVLKSPPRYNAPAQCRHSARRSGLLQRNKDGRHTVSPILFFFFLKRTVVLIVLSGHRGDSKGQRGRVGPDEGGAE